MSTARFNAGSVRRLVDSAYGVHHGGMVRAAKVVPSTREASVNCLARYIDPAYSALPAYFYKRLHPALQILLDAAVAAKAVRPGTEAYDLLRAVANLCRLSPE
jgi:hypothetical protein